MRPCLCLLLACTALTAAAQPTVRQEPDRQVVRPRAEVRFSPGEVPGDVHKPGGGTITVRRPARRFEPLLKVRAHFHKELQESAGQL